MSTAALQAVIGQLRIGLLDAHGAEALTKADAISAELQAPILDALANLEHQEGDEQVLRTIAISVAILSLSAKLAELK